MLPNLACSQTTTCLTVHVWTGYNGIYLVNTFFAIFRIYSDWNWNKLPQEYLQSPYLTIDTKSLGSHFGQSGQDKNIVDISGENAQEMLRERQGNAVTCDIPKYKV